MYVFEQRQTILANRLGPSVRMQTASVVFLTTNYMFRFILMSEL